MKKATKVEKVIKDELSLLHKSLRKAAEAKKRELRQMTHSEAATKPKEVNKDSTELETKLVDKVADFLLAIKLNPKQGQTLNQLHSIFEFTEAGLKKGYDNWQVEQIKQIFFGLVDDIEDTYKLDAKGAVSTNNDANKLRYQCIVEILRFTDKLNNEYQPGNAYKSSSARNLRNVPDVFSSAAEPAVKQPKFELK